MKIIHTINYFQPQLGYQEYFLAKEHVKLGHEVHVITSDRYYPIEDYDNTAKPVLGDRILTPGESRLEGFTIHRLETLLEKGARVKLKNIERLIEKINPDLVIHHGVTSNYLINNVVSCQRKLKFRLICDNHMHFCAEDHIKTLSKLYNFLYYYLHYHLYWKKSVTKFVAYSEDVKGYLTIRNYIPASHIDIIPLGVDINLFRFNQETRNKYRKEYNYAEDETVIIYTGKLIKSKDPILIFHACKEFMIEKKIKLLFIGSFSETYKAEFSDAIAGYEPHIRVIDIVPNKELVNYYNMADIAIWPKQASMAMLEAAACRLPLIIPTIVEDRIKNGNGISFEEGNVIELKKAIELMISDKEKLITMGLNSESYIRDQYDWQSIAKQFIAVS
ncbi:MAG: glycosyltransferase family 4 protein [Bacteroidota bacterium]